MKKRFYLSIIIASIICVSATSNKQQEIVFDKLVGLWKSKKGTSFEKWTKKDNGSYEAKSFRVRGTDTSWTEQVNIFKENDKWIYEVTVKGQNNGKAVKFTSAMLNDNSVLFSNPAHDFPTDIGYTVADDNTVNAFIVGPNKNGGKDTIPFSFTRVK